MEKVVYVNGFGLMRVPVELQGVDLERYVSEQVDKSLLSPPAPPAPPKKQPPSPGILSQAGAFLGSIPEGIAQGVGSTVSGIGALTTIDALKQAGQGISQFGEDISKELLDEEQRQSLGGAGGRLVGNLATYLTPGVFAKVAGLGGRAALGIGSAVSGLSGAGEQSQRIAEAREAGKQISEAEEAGLSALAGAGSAALEALPLGKMLGSPVAQKLPLVGRLFREAGELAPDVVKGIEKRFAGEAPDVAAVKIAEELARQKESLIANLGTGARVKSALQAGALESPVEGLQNTLQNVITKYAYDPEQQITEGLKESLIAGGLGGTAIQGGIEIFQAKQAKSANERAMARAKREQSAPPVAPETAAQTTVFIDPVTGTQRVVDRETPKEKGVRKIEESIAKAGEVPEGIRGLLPPGGPVRQLDTEVGSITVPSDATPEQINQIIEDIKQGRREREEAGAAATRDYIQRQQAEREATFQKQLPPGGEYTQVVAPSGRMITLPAGATQQDIDFADKQLQELEEQTQRSNEASRLFYEKGLEIKAKKDLKDATKFVNQNPEVADTVFSQMGIESLADVEAKDIPTFVDLMLEETYKRQEKLTAANKNIQDNYPIASYLAREELKKSLGKLNDNQKLELSALVDTQVQLNQKEYQDAVEEAEIRTAMGVEGSSVEPVDVRQKRAAQAIYGKPLEKLSTPSFFPSATPSVSELETVGKLVDEGDIRSLQITPEEMLERKQFEGMPFTTAKYRQVLDVLQANPDTPVTTNYIKETFDLPAPAANSMMALLRKRGDLKEVEGKGAPKYFVEPKAEGPLYEMVEPTPQPQPTGEQLFNIAQTTTTQPEFDEKIAAQYAPDLVAALKKRKAEDLFLLGISNALLDAKGNVQPANGQYLNRVIYLAYSPEGKVRTKEDMIKTLDHEIIHGMKALNLFSDAEWKMLTTRFKISYLGEEREKAYRNRYASRKDLNSLLQEEAIAKAAADFSNVDPKRLDPVAKSLVKKVEAFLGFGRTAAQMGYASAEDVLAAVKSGEIGGRRFTPFYEQTITGKEISAPREIKIPAAGKVAEFVRPAPEAKAATPPVKETPKGKKGNKGKAKTDVMVQEPESQAQTEAAVAAPEEETSSVTPEGLVRAFSPRSKENLVDKIYNFFSIDRRSSFRQKFLDRYDPVKEWAIKAYEQTGDRKYLAAASGAYQALLFSDKAQDIAMAGLEFGGFSYDGSIFRAVENEKNSPIKLFGELAAMPASQSGFANKLEEFFEAAYARRYLDLAEGQNRDPGGVVKIEDVRRTWDAFKDDKVIDDAMKRFKAFNDNLIDVLRKSGFIDKKMAESWKQSYYIPFYRLPTVKTQDGDVETGEVDAPKVGTKATNLAAAKSLSGRNLRVNDAMENIIYNTYFMIGTAMKNVAGERIVRDGITTGYIKELPIDPTTKRRVEEDPGSNVISIRENGVKKFYQVDDPLVYDAVAKSTIPVQDALKMMGSFTTALRRGVTTTPSFILKNPIRDTLQVWMQGGFGSDLTPPVGEYVKGITSVLQNSPEYRALQGAGIAGSGIRTQNIASAAKSIREKIGVEQRAFYKKFYDILENAADKSEGISRVQAYKNALEKTGDEAEALFAAMETINFSRRGTSRGAQVAIALLPFFNARLQGLDVAYRTLKGDKMIPTELTGSSKKAVYTRMAYVSALSGVYAVLISGTKAWLNATDEERDSNIFVPIDWIPGIKEGTALKFPIPQELGLVTKMFPERLVSYYRGLDDGPELVDAMARGLLATLSMNPIPQIFRPYFEHTANFDMYTQKPIENAYLQRLLPEERYTEYTSEVYKMAGQAMGVSPVKLDHLIRGYTGSLGAMTADIIGMILEEGKAAPKPERIRFSEPYLLPGIGQLFRSANGRKAVEDLYELDEAANMAVATLRAVSRGQREMSPERQDELRSMLYIDKAIQPTLKRVQALNRMKRTVLAAEDMSPEQKRDELNSIQEEIVSLSSEIKDLKSELPLRFRVGLSKLLGF